MSRQVRLRNWDELTLLGAVSLSICAGELVAIVGPSGAGKTMLLEAVAGVTPETSRSERFDVYGNRSTRDLFL
jgi:ABC-type sulfate/molybdate transport systems ATPase subunit